MGGDAGAARLPDGTIVGGVTDKNKKEGENRKRGGEREEGPGDPIHFGFNLTRSFDLIK